MNWLGLSLICVPFIIIGFWAYKNDVYEDDE